MTILGLENAIPIAINRVRRMKESICIVEIANDEFVLWRESTIINIAQVYTRYKVIMTVRIEPQ